MNNYYTALFCEWPQNIVIVLLLHRVASTKYPIKVRRGLCSYGYNDADDKLVH